MRVKGQLERLRQRWWMRGVDQLGADATIVGRPIVGNGGHMHIGRRFHLRSEPAVSHIMTGEGAHLVVGDDVHVSHGAALFAAAGLQIGDRSRLGPFVTIMDTDFHVIGDRDHAPEPLPVRIGCDVVIGAGVTILRGSDIGDGATVSSGSVVSGSVLAGTRVAGVPARTAHETSQQSLEASVGERMCQLAAEIFTLESQPGLSDGPHSIGQWDSLGALKLLLGIEDVFQRSLSEADFKQAKTLEELASLVERTD